jgi:hypothetical protein
MGAMTRSQNATKGQTAAWCALLLLVSLLSLRGWGTLQVGVYQDDAAYVVLARSLAFADAYGSMNVPGTPAPTRYPFGFPLVLTPLVGWFPHEPLAATLASLAATLISISLLYWGWPWFSPATSRWWGLGVGSLYGLSPGIMGQTREVMSDPVFTALVLLALLLTELFMRGRSPAGVSKSQGVSGGGPEVPAVLPPVPSPSEREARTGATSKDARHPSPSYRVCAALGAVLMLTLFTRWLGAVVWVVVLARIVFARTFAWQDRCRSVAAILGAGLGSLALVLVLTPIDLTQLSPGTYFMQRRDPPVRRTTGTPLKPGLDVVVEYASDKLRRVLVPIGSGERERVLLERFGLPQLSTAVSLSATALVIIGGWQAVRTAALAPSVLGYEILYFGALSQWPAVTPRYLYPILPFLIVHLLLAVGALGRVILRRWSEAKRRSQTVPVVAVWTVLVVVSTWKSWRVEDSRRFTGDLRLGATWLAAHSPPDAVVMAQYPHATYLYAERKAVRMAQVETAAELDRVLHDRDVDYLLLRPELKWRVDGVHRYDKHTHRVLLPAVAELASQGHLALVYESRPEEMVRVYRVER